MLDNILLMASQVGTLFLMMGVGFVLAKWKKLTDQGLSQITFLLLNIVCPCIIIDALQIEREPGALRSMGVGALIMCAAYGVWALLAQLTFRRQPEKTRSVLRFGQVYGNIGFMGLPLIEAVLGAPAVVYATTPYVVFTVIVWIHGAALMGGRRSISLKNIILNPGVVGCAIGLALFLLRIRLPSLVGSAVGFLGSMNTPLAMLVIGAQMAGANLGATVRSPRLYLASAVRLLVFPAILLVALLPLRLDGTMYTAYVILAATPVAGFTSILGQRFGQDTASAAQLVSLSTLLSIVTLPCVAAVARTLAG